MREKRVLIVSSRLDDATERVQEHLTALGVQFSRLNTDDLPYGDEVTHYIDNRQTSPLSPHFEELELASVWVRKIRRPHTRPSGGESLNDYIGREAKYALIGGLMSMSCYQMSPVDSIWRAEHKVFQLEIARQFGLRVPRTVVTNSADEILRAFREFNGAMIIKPVRSGYVDLGDERLAVYTSEVLQEHLDRLDGDRQSFAIYQELIEKDADIRVTFVAPNNFFVARIESQLDSSARVDWRRTEDPDLPHSIEELPASLVREIARFMNRLGLEFGALDFAKTKSGDYVFFEVNPNGQWLWVEDLLQLPISKAVAERLSSGAGKA